MFVLNLKISSCSCKNFTTPRISNRYAGSIYSLMTVAKGESTMVETVFENRFQHLEEMRRMGLHSEIIRDTARIVGGQPLQGAEVLSTDLRAVLP